MSRQPTTYPSGDDLTPSQLNQASCELLRRIMKAKKLPGSGITRKEQMIRAIIHGEVTPEIKAMRYEPRTRRQRRVHITASSHKATKPQANTNTGEWEYMFDERNAGLTNSFPDSVHPDDSSGMLTVKTFLKAYTSSEIPLGDFTKVTIISADFVAPIISKFPGRVWHAFSQWAGGKEFTPAYSLNRPMAKSPDIQSSIQALEGSDKPSQELQEIFLVCDLAEKYHSSARFLLQQLLAAMRERTYLTENFGLQIDPQWRIDVMPGSHNEQGIVRAAICLGLDKWLPEGVNQSLVASPSQPDIATPKADQSLSTNIVSELSGLRHIGTCSDTAKKDSNFDISYFIGQGDEQEFWSEWCGNSS